MFFSKTMKKSIFCSKTSFAEPIWCCEDSDARPKTKDVQKYVGIRIVNFLLWPRQREATHQAAAVTTKMHGPSLVCRTFVWGNPGMTYLTNEAFKLSIHYGIVLIIYFMLIVCYLVRRKTAKHFTLGVPISHHDSYPPGLPATASPISAAGSRPRVPVAWKSMIWYRRWSCQH